MPHRITTFDNPATLTEAITLYQAGASTSDLATRYSCGTETIRRHLLHAGVTLRPNTFRPKPGTKPRIEPTRPKAPTFQPTHLTDMPWYEDARCRVEGNPESFYPTMGSREAGQQAIAICRRCPVLELCRDWALDNRQKWGIWGGLTERQRRLIITQRNKAAKAAQRTAA
jgi:WhiB family transcriptional regulator, redox-sensing transcriptional regulator